MSSGGCEVKKRHPDCIIASRPGQLDFALEKCEHFSLLGHKFTQT
jgi:hypothetical protein